MEMMGLGSQVMVGMWCSHGLLEHNPKVSNGGGITALSPANS